MGGKGRKGEEKDRKKREDKGKGREEKRGEEREKEECMMRKEGKGKGWTGGTYLTCCWRSSLNMMFIQLAK